MAEISNSASEGRFIGGGGLSAKKFKKVHISKSLTPKFGGRIDFNELKIRKNLESI